MSASQQQRLPINFAHRGASGICPENTMAAFRKALELGADGIETDVQMTKDGKLVLIHDDKLDRTTDGSGYVQEHTLAEIAALDAGRWFKPEFAGERVPTLEELLGLVRDRTNVIVNLELKNSELPYAGMEEAVIAAVEQAGLKERILISTFNHYSLKLCKRLAPDIRTGLLYTDMLYEPWAYAAALGSDALHAYRKRVTPEYVAEARGHGVAYHPWTVNDEEQMTRLLDMGVSAIITDYPDVLAALLEQRA